jgi:hypothetical protein
MTALQPDGLPPHHSTFLYVWTLPAPWPPGRPNVHRQHLGAAELEVYVGTDEGRISAILWERNGNNRMAIAEGKSRPILASGREIVIVSVKSERGKIEFRLNGQCVTYLNSLDDEPVMVQSNGGGQSSPFLRFAEKNRKQLARRAGTFKNLIEKKDKASRKHMFSSLAEEAQILRNCLEGLERGETFHIRTISSRLRLLLVKQGQVPLLQACAALKKLPITVYCPPYPDQPLPFREGLMVSITLDPLRANPEPPYTTPVDVDLWLSFNALLLGDINITNHELISDIGNTIGSHLDPKPIPAVVSLRSGRIGSIEMTLDKLQIYFMNIAKAIQPVCEFVASFEHESRSSEL